MGHYKYAYNSHQRWAQSRKMLKKNKIFAGEARDINIQ
jgi:hypothetical protein